jgi:hypothetical protein
MKLNFIQEHQSSDGADIGLWDICSNGVKFDWVLQNQLQNPPTEVLDEPKVGFVKTPRRIS